LAQVVMLIRRTFAAVKRFLPGFLAVRARALATAVLTPMLFSYETGHFRSSLLSMAVDRRGNPIPWYAYPAIDHLESLDFSDCSVLEIGAGQSTLWWAARSREVLSLEADQSWFERLQGRMPSNAILRQVSIDLSVLPPELSGREFDIVVVDGCDRFVASGLAVRVLKPGGAVIVDNAEGYWGPEGTYPIMDLFRSEGFQRVDFYGYSPGVIGRQCTSIFFRPDSFMFGGRHNPRRLAG